MDKEKQSTLRPATKAEQAIHDAFVESILSRAIATTDPEALGKLIKEMNVMERRYGWVGSSDNLMVSEEKVWRDIRRKNPQPDILDTNDNELLALSWKETKDFLTKLTGKAP